MNDLLFDPNSVPHILLVYACIITFGIALGRVKIFGIQLGITVVLFMGILAAHFGIGVNRDILIFMQNFGQILFIFFIGIQVGPSLISGLKTGGVLFNSLMAGGILVSIVITVALWFGWDNFFGGHISLPSFLGVYYGAVTNTPGLGATNEILQFFHYAGEDIAVGYACAYPFGILGIILSIILIKKIFRINLAEEDKAWEEAQSEKQEAPVYFQVEVVNAFLEGRTIAEIRRFINRSFVCSRLLSKETGLSSPNAETKVHTGDILRIVTLAENQDAIIAFFGKKVEQTIDLSTEHSPINSKVILISDTSVNGVKVKDLHLSHDNLNATRVFRAGMELFPFPGLHLQMGDKIRVVGPERALARLEVRLGNKAQRLEKPNMVSIMVGVALGIFVGCIPISVPGIPVPVKLGLAGGPLIVAILIGLFGPHFGFVTYTANSASLMMKQLGMGFFLASLGLASGAGFTNAFASGTGFIYMGFGLLITFIPLLVMGAVARHFFGMNFHSIAGLLAGAQTNSAALAYAASLSEKNCATVAYSTVYPIAMILRILSGQIILMLFWAGVS